MKYNELIVATADKLYHEVVPRTKGIHSFKDFVTSKKMSPEKVKFAIMFAADAVLYEERSVYIRANKYITGFHSCTITSEGTVVSESENLESRYREFKEYVIKEFDKHFQ